MNSNVFDEVRSTSKTWRTDVRLLAGRGRIFRVVDSSVDVQAIGAVKSHGTLLVISEAGQAFSKLIDFFVECRGGFGWILTCVFKPNHNRKRGAQCGQAYPLAGAEDIFSP